MVKVADISLDTTNKKAKVDLESDTRTEISGLSTDDIVGFPKGYTIDFMSTVFTSAGELAFMQSDGTWNWGD